MDNFLTLDEKVDLLIKKYFSKPYTHTNLPFFQEPPVFVRPFILPDQIWSRRIPDRVPDDIINSTIDDLGNSIIGSIVGKTSSSNGVIRKYVKVQLEFLSASDTMIAFKGPEYQGKNILINSVPFNYDQFGTTYEYELYKFDGDLIFFTEGEWILDNDSGILTFSSLTTNLSESKPPSISFYRYVGESGLDLRANKSEVYSKNQANSIHDDLINTIDQKSNITQIYFRENLYTRDNVDVFIANMSSRRVIDTDGDTFIKVEQDGFIDTDMMLFYTNNSHRMTLTNTGNLGINTETPTQLVHIKNGNLFVDNGDIIAEKNISVEGQSVLSETIITPSYTSFISDPILTIETNLSNQTYNLIVLETNDETDIRFKSSLDPNGDWLVGLGKEDAIGGNQSFYIYNKENDNFYITMEPNTTDPNITGYINVGTNSEIIDLDVKGNVITNMIKPTRDSSKCLSITHSDKNCKVGIGVEKPLYELQVNGTIYGQIITTPSDKRLKKNVKNLSNVLSKIQQLQGVSFEWDSENILCNKSQIGLIAQDVEKVFPEIVYTDTHGLKSMTYDKITTILIEAIKELNDKVDYLIENKK